MPVRVVFFSDTHLGLDMPAHPRVEKFRRGEDFFANVERVLAYAAEQRVDLVLHGGDMFFRSRVPPFIVDRVYARLVRFVEETRIPFAVIAGNHERSTLPSSLLMTHPLLHVFHKPSTHRFDLGGALVDVTGIPFVGHGARFLEHAREALDAQADHALLLAHEAFEGAVVGAGSSGKDFVFPRERDDVVPLADLPSRFDLVLSGHIHRRQWLRASSSSSSSAAAAAASAPPVVYAGSVERTSFAEMREEKAFALVELTATQQRTPGAARDATARGDAPPRGRARFVRLPARPMLEVDDEAALESAPRDAIVRVRGERFARLPR